MRAHLAPWLVVLVMLGLSGCVRVRPAEPPPAAPAPEPQAPEVWAPEAQNVCQHVRIIASAQEGSDAAPPAIESECSAALDRLREHYDTLSSCLLKSTTVDEVRACEQPFRTWTGVIAKKLAPVSPEAVCEHVLGVMQKELGPALPMSPEDIAKFRMECVKEMNSEQAKLGDERFLEQATCVLEASDFSAMARCDKEP